jgi:precorrin-4/cobalt-precorrin-4 C11-methyltransferase
VARSKIWFLGAGPGAPDLLTVRAARVLAQADVVVWGKNLMDDGLVAEHARPDAELLSWPPATMDDIRAVYDRAQTEELVVARLLWGDTCIYGSVRDEVRRVQERGLDYEVVPGIGAFSAAAATLGIDLTRAPAVSQSLILTAPSAPEPMHELARFDATLAIYMVRDRGEEMQRELLRGGYAPDSPCAVMHRVTREGEVILACRLDELAATLATPGIESNTLVLVGAALRDDFGEGEVAEERPV